MHLGGCNQAWRSFRAGNCVTSLIRWRVVNRGQCTRPTFLAGHYNARFTGVGLVCVCSCTQGCAAVHVRALHRKIPGVRIKFSSLCECSWEKRQDSGKSGILFTLSLSLYFCLSRLSGRTSKDERDGCVSNHRRRDRFWTRDRGRINDSYAASVGVVWNSCSVPCLCQHQKFMHVVDSATLYPCLMKVPFIFLSLCSRFIKI